MGMHPKINIWGDTIDGRYLCEKRSISMTETVPPEDATWHHYTQNVGSGMDDTHSPLSEQTEEDWRAIRLAWLDQFELVISVWPEDGYRVWRWLGASSTGPSSYTGRSVRWSERRPWSAPLPKVPGLWPSDK